MDSKLESVIVSVQANVAQTAFSATTETYSAWLFDILFEVERRIEIQDDPVQGRVMGYLSERLLSVWVRHNRLKICYKTVLMVNDQKRKGLGKHLFHTTVNTLAYWITYPLRRRSPRRAAE